MADLALATIGFAGQCYSGAVQAYLTLQRCIEFPDTSAKLLIQLEVERIRLQLWGCNSGADVGILRPGLAPFESTICDILVRIGNLLKDSEKLTKSYGLVRKEEGIHAQEDAGAENQKRRAVENIKSVFNAVFASHDKRRKEPQAPSGEGNLSRTKPISSYDRVRWGISSQSLFEDLISNLRQFVNSLNDLLRESQQVILSREWRLLELEAIAEIDDPESLRAIQEATGEDANCRTLFSLARRKSIIVTKPQRGRMPDHPSAIYESSAKVLSKEDFELPDDFPTLSRCIAVYNPLDSRRGDAATYTLIEKKFYDVDIMSQDKFTLFFRLQRLIELLNLPSGESDALLPCLGYWSEPASHCWCLAYRFPLHNAIIKATPSLDLALTIQPPSLLLLLSSDTFKPAMESRLLLASAIATAFSGLYGSKWLHKGVRSENILFPLTMGGLHDISKPLVAGFEYSRQYTELATIDRSPFNLSHAIYRHPRYQGLAAKGYKMTYDVYSLGLVLAEIAWWMPLRSFLQAKPKHISKLGTSESAIETQTFGAEEATELRRQVLKRARKELAFRVGSTYKEVVEWCLNCEDDAGRSDREVSIEFYKHVVVPLERMTAAFEMGN